MGEGAAYVLVTGGNGYVGSHVVAELARDHSAPWREVRALVRSDAGAARVRALGGVPVYGDLLDGAEGRWRDVAAGASWVVHCAQPKKQDDFATARLAMDRQLVEALAPGRVRRAVLVYGTSYYGRTLPGEIVDETMAERRPVGFGQAFEPCVAMMRAAGRRGLDAVAAFVGGPYGSGAWFVRMYAQAIACGEPIPMREPAPLWPLVHIEDTARALSFLLRVDAARLDAVGREVIVATQEAESLDALVTGIAARLGQPARIAHVDVERLRALLPPSAFPFLSADLAHRATRLGELGFTWNHPRLAEGMAGIDLASG